MTEPRQGFAAAGAAAAAAAIVGTPLVVAGVGAADGPPSSPAVSPPTPPPPPAEATVPRGEYERVRRKSWRRLMGWRRAERQRERLKTAMRRSVVAGVRAGLLCIHDGEGSWSANTGNGYFGGLQMDYSFQRAYGAPLLRRYGTANHWPIGAQLAVGEVAFWAGRGFGPWPLTRLGCGI